MKNCAPFSDNTIINALHNPNAQRYTIARFHNRQDAQDYMRFLNRFVPTAEFELLFDVSPKQL